MSDQSLPRLLLLRHGEVASHRGDVPVTEQGLKFAERIGKLLGARHSEPMTMLYGGTRRSRQTAEAIVEGINDSSRVTGPVDAFALRNPDIYVSGVRVNMVSSAAALAEQVPGLSEQDATANLFFADFIPSKDRIGWWLSHSDPPGDSADSLADRVEAFARSIDDPGPLRGRLVIGVTHSPLLRSVLRRGTGRDPGEPAYITGAQLTVRQDRTVTITPYDATQS